MSSRTFEWNWVCKTSLELPELKPAKAIPVQHHPLQSSVLIEGEVKSDRAPGRLADPLTSRFEGSDPLSALAAQQDWDDIEEIEAKEERRGRGRLSIETEENPWIEQRAAILSKFTTNQKLSMYSRSAAAGGGRGEAGSGPPGLRHKLEQLDETDEISLRSDQLSQAEYIETLSQFGRELIAAWDSDLRVKALKIAIQTAKLLVDTSVVQFYPSKFVLSTDVLDHFGNLVYERLLSKSEYCPRRDSVVSPTLGESLSPEMVRETAKETCRNWFYKVASIRELIPRLYVEAALLSSYSFLDKREVGECVKRLTLMIRGIGDPLVAAYTRCYLCRVAHPQLSPQASLALISSNIYDFLALYHQIFTSPTVQEQLNNQKVDMSSYLGTYVPALDWMFQALVNTGDIDVLNDVFCKAMEKKNKGLLLNAILSTYKPDFLVLHCETLIKQIGSCFGDYFPGERLLRQLGEKVRGQAPASSGEIARSAWLLVSKLEHTPDFLASFHAWAPFIVSNLTVPELNHILGDVLKKVSHSSKGFHMIIHDIILTIVSAMSDFDLIFTMDKFLGLIDLVKDDHWKALTCQKVLEMYCSWSGEGSEGVPPSRSSADPVTTDALLFIAKLLHDSVNALSVEDEKRQYGSLISRLIRKIHFDDFDQQLRFYVDARATFMNLDPVIVTLVHCVNRLAVERGQKVKTHHTRRSGAFVHACAAYSFITIPSITSQLTRLRLYLATAQVALFNQALAQADACIASALTLLPQLSPTLEIDGKERDMEPFLTEYVKNMLSTLIVVPDCPEEGVLHLTRGLVNMLQECSGITGTAPLIRLYLSVIRMLTVAARSDYPYHIRNVDSNDVLYGSDPKFLAEINKMCSVLLEEILNNLQALGESGDYATQGEIALELCLVVISSVNLEAEGMAKLAYQLWNLSRKHIDDKIILSQVLTAGSPSSLALLEYHSGHCQKMVSLHRKYLSPTPAEPAKTTSRAARKP